MKASAVSKLINEACLQIDALAPKDQLAALNAREFAYWVSDGGCDQLNWCYDCCTAEVSRLRTEEYPDASVDGGWLTDHDSVPHCNGCGCELLGTLTDHGLLEEMEHFEEHGPDLGLLNVLHSVDPRSDRAPRALRLADALIGKLKAGREATL